VPVSLRDLREVHGSDQLFTALLEPTTKPAHARLWAKVGAWLATDDIRSVKVASNNAVASCASAYTASSFEVTAAVKLGTCTVLFNPSQFHRFLGAVSAAEKQQKLPTFDPPRMPDDDDDDDDTDLESQKKNSTSLPPWLPRAQPERDAIQRQREYTLLALERAAKRVMHNRTAEFARVWLCTYQQQVGTVLADGVASIAMRPNGWYGRGMYFSTSAIHALNMFRAHQHLQQKQVASTIATSATPSTGTAANCPTSPACCLVMCYALLTRAYPVVAVDAPPAPTPPTAFRFYGADAYSSQFGAHYSLVVPVPVTSDTTTTSTPEYRPALHARDAVYDELVVFNDAHILPQLIINLVDP